VNQAEVGKIFVHTSAQNAASATAKKAGRAAEAAANNPPGITKGDTIQSHDA